MKAPLNLGAARLAWPLAAATLLLAFACGSDDGAAPTRSAGFHAGASAGEAGCAGELGTSGGPAAGGTTGRAGEGTTDTGGNANAGAAHAPDAGGGAGCSGDGQGGHAEGGRPGPNLPQLEDIVDHGAAQITTTPRSDFGAVLVVADGKRVYAVEARRDIEAGPFGLPWRSRFRLAAYDDGVESWSYAAEPDDVISDVAVHPSGDVTFALLHHPPERMAFDLLRFDRAGIRVATTTLAEPETIPAGDYGASDPQPLFRMKSDFADATVGGWVRLLPHGEGLYVAFLSYVDVPATDPLSTRLALGVEALTWDSAAYSESWARVVEGPHAAQPAAWAYDELRWREQAIRPFLAADPLTGDVLVGRAWNSTRCAANVAVFAEFDANACLVGSVNPLENERLPLAVTRFDATGARFGTSVIVPDDDAAEQVPFALAARGGRLAVAGAVVRKLADGSPRTYPDENGNVDYDGYVALHEADGSLALHHDFNLGRGDVLAALRWTSEGVVAVGSSGWDRWQGGMSISRGSDPLLVWLSADGVRSTTRVLPMTDGSRHFNLHDVAVSDRSIVAHGFADAPMTHSADGGNDAARTFGALRISLSETD